MHEAMALPVQMVFEVVATVGLLFVTLRMATGYTKRPGRWGLGVVLVVFGIHRASGWLVSRVDVADLTHVPGGVLLAMALPVAGSLFVFVLAPFVLPRVIPDRPVLDSERDG